MMLCYGYYNMMGNAWGDIEDRYFKEHNITEAQIKNHWYSQQFKNYVAGNFGSDAYQQRIKQRGQVVEQARLVISKKKAEHEQIEQRMANGIRKKKVHEQRIALLQQPW